ncbi:MAG: hypothetical protein ACUVRV_11015 [Cyanobacteriota bacterium]
MRSSVLASSGYLFFGVGNSLQNLLIWLSQLCSHLGTGLYRVLNASQPVFGIGCRDPSSSRQ